MAINGTPGVDTLTGLSGDDVINGLDGNDKLDGGAGNDVIDGGAGADIIKGGDGDDTLTGGSGNDNIVGGAGQDIAIYATAVAAASTGAAPIGSWNGALLTLATGLDGTDVVNQVEALRFNGQDFAVTGYVRGETYNVVANLGEDRASATDDRTPVSGNVLSNDYDVDSRLTVTGVRFGDEKPPAAPSDDPKAQDAKPAGFKISGDHGTLVLNSDGTYSYEASGNGAGVDHFQYSVTDGGVTRWVNLDINVTHVNHAPDTDSQSAAGSEDSTISGQVFAKDKDGDSLTFTLGSGPQHGSLDFHSDGTYSYTPDADFNGSDGFDFTVSDGHGGTNQAHVDLHVSPVNDAPSIDEDIPVAVSGPAAFNLATEGVVSFDVTGHVAANGDPQGGIQYGDGGVTREQLAALGVSGAYLDGIGDFLGATVIQVNLGDLPDGLGSFEFDFDFDTVAGSHDRVIVTYGGIALDYGAFHDAGEDWQDGLGINGLENVSLQIVLLDFAGDGFVSSLTYYNTHLKELNGPFMGTGNPIYITGGGGGAAPVEDTPFSGQFHAHDVEGDTLTFSLVSGPAHGSVTVHGDGSFVYTPDADYNGSDSFSYQVDDGHGGTDTATWSFEVAAVNDAPVADDAEFEGLENQALSGALSATDVDGDTLVYTLGAPKRAPGGPPAGALPGVEHGALDFHSDGTFTYTPDHGFFGTETFSYTVDDGHGGVSMGTVTLNVEAHNFDPVANDASFGGNEDSNISGQVSASDADGDSLYYVASGPQHGSLSFNSDGSFVYTPNADYNGSDSFDFTVEDGNGGSDTGHVTLDIAPVNDAPEALEPRRVNTDEETAISGSASARDVDKDSLTFELVGDGLTGLTFNKDGTWSFDPTKDAGLQKLDYDQFVNLSFSYRAYDGHGYSEPMTQTIRVFGLDEYIAGTAAKETINGTAAGDYIDGLAGDDTLRGNGGSDQLFGGEGSDKLYGGDGNDQLAGGAGADTVNGEAGNDTLQGEAGADTMDGGDGDDWVMGGDDNDVVKGGAGNDHVHGDAGNDDVQGGIGDDWVFGGAGADRLSGGTGADHFVFLEGDLGSTLATSDTVTDFKASQGDVLDFTGIDADTTLDGDQAFSLVGSFGHHAGEMTLAFNAGINATVVSMDSNGDGVADYMLQLSGQVSSTAGWML